MNAYLIEKKMKVYFGANETVLLKNKKKYFEHMAVAIYSCKKNTKLDPYILYDGPMDEIVYFKELGSTIIEHELSFKKDLKRKCDKFNIDFGVASGAFLRIDIPLLEKNDEFIIYADLDVMFMRDPVLQSLRPTYLAATSEMQFDISTRFNSGVMIINVKNFGNVHDEFIHFILNQTPTYDPYDEGPLNDFFSGKWDPMDQSYNWKPYWGYNHYAPIVHWHGVKYGAAIRNQANEFIDYDGTLHRKIYEKNPEGYTRYITHFQNFLKELPEK